MSNLSKLKKGRKSTKGAPPALDAAPGNTGRPPRTLAPALSSTDKPLPENLETKAIKRDPEDYTEPTGQGVDPYYSDDAPSPNQGQESKPPDAEHKNAKAQGASATSTHQDPLTTETDAKEPNQALQLKVPMSVYNAFSEAATKEFGYKKGNKTLMFLNMWEEWKKKT